MLRKPIAVPISLATIGGADALKNPGDALSISRRRSEVNYNLWVDGQSAPCLYRPTMTQTDSQEIMDTDPRAVALLDKINKFFADRERAGEPISEYRFGIDIRYSTLLERLRAGSGVGHMVTRRVEEYIKANEPKRRRK